MYKTKKRLFQHDLDQDLLIEGPVWVETLSIFNDHTATLYLFIADSNEIVAEDEDSEGQITALSPGVSTIIDFSDEGEGATKGYGRRFIDGAYFSVSTNKLTRVLPETGQEEHANNKKLQFEALYRD